MESTLVDVHDCVKYNGKVILKAKVVESHRGNIVHLIAHQAHCKEAK